MQGAPACSSTLSLLPSINSQATFRSSLIHSLASPCSASSSGDLATSGMALMRPPSLFLVVLLGITMPLLFFSRAEAAEVGVNYGRVANDLPQNQGSVVDLLKQNGITMVRIYDAFPDVLTSLANTGIKVMVMMTNENLAAAASDPSNALQWVQTNVKAFYPATQINGVAVGNEVFDSRPDLNSVLVPAMTNVQAALAQLGLADAVKVSTPVAFDALQTSYPPSEGSFKDELVPVMKSMLDFLQQTGSYLTVNIYPFFAYYNSLTTPNPISLDYALGNSGAAAVVDDNTDATYTNLLDAQLDATYYAMEALGFPSLRVHTTESGWPSRGKPRAGRPPSEVRRGGRRLLDSAADQDTAASVANAQAYNNNLINRVLAGRTGTPHRPDADMDVYIFALFNENDKGDADDTESNFGLFYPNETKVYSFDFQAPSQSWCVANAGVGDARLQAALDYACGNGADCSAIQPGGSCFQPDTVLAHASYAFNSYYQNKGRASGTCDFSGAASVVFQQPTGTCSAPVSWCVANAAVGDARLQTALDYACSNGADCSAIQPGGACFQPDTKASHASYAFNSYYQHKDRASGTCDFSGAGSIVYQQPTVGNCVLPSNG
ncbi:hypothetical protein BS78_02G303800 [Paspalum vaginatum]|nr:hypothetical protein BS78_02G303800 [Paspalum vaginatum]